MNALNPEKVKVGIQLLNCVKPAKTYCPPNFFPAESLHQPEKILPPVFTLKHCLTAARHVTEQPGLSACRTWSVSDSTRRGFSAHHALPCRSNTRTAGIALFEILHLFQIHR